MSYRIDAITIRRMERSKRDLESVISSQKDQLTRYETRLKDVVTAYKGLLKEKEALETSLSALTARPTKDEKNNEPGVSDLSKPTESCENLQLQIATLMNSLATLSAEKSRMEASFQSDKKHLRHELEKKSKLLSELRDKQLEYEQRSSSDLENMKSKVIIERHEREMESNNHLHMIKELQKLLSDERNLKDNLEMQLNNMKMKFSTAEKDNSSSKLKSLTNDLRAANDKIKELEDCKGTICDPERVSILQELQNEMKNLKQQHAIAIKSEQKRAHVAEESNKRLAALHENRVANLESRLAELSSTVGTYDRLRQQDQESIQKLKDKIVQLASNSVEHVELGPSVPKSDANTIDISFVVDEIMHLKKILLLENARSSNSIDINKIFDIGTNHSECLEDINRLQRELESAQYENEDLKQAVTVEKSHIRTLQEKVKVLNRNIEEQEVELKFQSDKLSQVLKQEKMKWKDVLNSMENECRGKLNDMEQQLQNQRSRSLKLLDDKENEIKTLRTSFELFTPQNRIDDACNTHQRKSSSTLNSVLNGQVNSGAAVLSSENCHMIHYANEIARKDVEITNLRKSKYSAETALRQALQDKVTAQEELFDKISNLEQQVDRLERCKTREGANLEYLKNVIISFISTRNVEGKIHMINAIGAVLQFTPNEITAINSIFNKK